MFRRLLLMGLLTTILVMPAFAALPSSSHPVIPAGESEAMCISDVLGTSEDGKTVTFRAVWEPNKYNCGAGYYLNLEDAACARCLAGYYCEGFSDFSFDGTTHGLEKCDDEYPNSAESATAATDCFKVTDVSCSEKNPYIYGHGTAVYRGGDITQCKQYYGADSCDLIGANACDIVALNCADGYESKTVDGELQCVSNKVHCEPGEYLPAGSESPAVCPADYYCTGGDYDVNPNADSGATKCAPGLKSPVGAKLLADCGHILRIGGDRLYLHSDKNTHPSLVVQIDGQPWYADMTPVSAGKKTISTDAGSKTMHMTVDGVDYTVHGRYVEFSE